MNVSCHHVWMRHVPVTQAIKAHKNHPQTYNEAEQRQDMLSIASLVRQCIYLYASYMYVIHVCVCVYVNMHICVWRRSRAAWGHLVCCFLGTSTLWLVCITHICVCMYVNMHIYVYLFGWDDVYSVIHTNTHTDLHTCKPTKIHTYNTHDRFFQRTDWKHMKDFLKGLIAVDIYFTYLHV